MVNISMALLGFVFFGIMIIGITIVPNIFSSLNNDVGNSTDNVSYTQGTMVVKDSIFSSEWIIVGIIVLFIITAGLYKFLVH